ncbi:hypothetical protein BC826DRAFT_625828 [Russula brevipes]|nr:hypothetical protein BC826DRAFT_625828 [Russula brevipes]
MRFWFVEVFPKNYRRPIHANMPSLSKNNRGHVLLDDWHSPWYHNEFLPSSSDPTPTPMQWTMGDSAKCLYSVFSAIHIRQSAIWTLIPFAYSNSQVITIPVSPLTDKFNIRKRVPFTSKTNTGFHMNSFSRLDDWALRSLLRSPWPAPRQREHIVQDT